MLGFFTKLNKACVSLSLVAASLCSCMTASKTGSTSACKGSLLLNGQSAHIRMQFEKPVLCACTACQPCPQSGVHNRSVIAVSQCLLACSCSKSGKKGCAAQVCFLESPACRKLPLTITFVDQHVGHHLRQLFCYDPECSLCS